ncbi:uncharacterized protein VP01_217g3 [Puccinia sorghi]|uniref:Uncharacterized protein n=1 Tax=Puccinia sorghi TaxID=27349 RepID=A0A0L6V9Z7_9BASI|nr:uncharacterized protein VP01_217g3 [Puccinia sorghi]
MSDCKITTPLLPNTWLVKCTKEEHNSFLQLEINYREALGHLNYLTVCTRQDIAFTVSQLSQHLERCGNSKGLALTERHQYGTKAGILLQIQNQCSKQP